MDVKLFELRDKVTFLPVICIKLSPRIEAERYLLARKGYGRTKAKQEQYVIMTALDGGTCTYDAYGHGGGTRTRQVAHSHIIENWDDLKSGQVIDVEFVLEETAQPKISEALEDSPAEFVSH